MAEWSKSLVPYTTLVNKLEENISIGVLKTTIMKEYKTTYTNSIKPWLSPLA